MKILAISYRDASRKKNIFLPLFQKEAIEKGELFSSLPVRIRASVKELWKKEFRGEEGEAKSIWFPKGPIRRVRLFGWGAKEKWNWRKGQLVARKYVQAAKSERIEEFATPFGASLGISKKEAASVFAANALMACFEFNKYKEAPKEGWPEVRSEE